MDEDGGQIWHQVYIAQISEIQNEEIRVWIVTETGS